MANASIAREPSTRTPVFHGSLARGYLWVFLIAPVATVPLFSRNFFELSLANMAVSLAGNVLVSWTVPFAVLIAYRFVLQPWLGRTRGAAARIFAHAVVSTAAASLAALTIRPAMILVSNELPPPLGFVAGCVVMTWGFLVPGLIIERYQDLAADRERKLQAERESALRAELEALRARTEPHFLFNALNTVASLIADDPKLAEATVERLASVLRYVLASAGGASVPLRDEVEAAVDYLEVQRARFGDRLRYELDVESGAEALRVPPMILQPLVENAVLHGVSRRKEGCVVRVCARHRFPMLEITVHDDGCRGERSQHEGTGTSLRDLRRRLEILYGSAGSFEARADESGFTVEIVVPDENHLVPEVAS